MRLDHAVLATSDHERLVSRAAAAGLDAAFGGVHDHGTTQMSVLGFPDGSYLELLGPTEDTDPEDAEFWPDHLARDAGPTAWCLLVDDVRESAVAHVRAGVPVDGPHHRGRDRPDGTSVEWDMAFYGAETHGTTFPFVIADRTPRRYRVTPTGSLAGGPIAGVAEIVLAVDDAAAWADRFADCYGTPRPVRFDHPTFDAPLFDVSGHPLVLAESAPALPGPSAFLLGASDLDAAGESVDLVEAADWHGRRVAWVEGFEGELGVVEPEAGGPVSAGPNRA
jgi:hypothetical protein